MRLFWPVTIRGKIIFILAACFGFMGAVLVLNSLNLKRVEQRLRRMETVEEFSNTVLEIRRFEKNYIIYQDQSSYDEALAYVDQAQAMATKLRQEQFLDAAEEADLGASLTKYRDSLTRLHLAASMSGAGGDSWTKREEELREDGRVLIDLAHNLVRGERTRIASTLRLSRFVPYLLLAAFLALVLALANVMASKIITPLRYLERTTRKIAEGDFTTIPLDKTKRDEIHALISGFNKMIHEISARQEQLIQSRKMAAVGTLSSGIAHELNNPINNITLTVDLIMDEWDDMPPEEKKRLINDISTQLERASEIVRSLLDFTRTEKPILTTFAIQEVVASTLKLVKNEIELGAIEVENRLSADLPLLRGDPRKLRQVFLNLFINGIQAMPSGGQLTIAAEPHSDGFMEVSVADTGVGIAPGNLGRIFEPFFTTKEMGTGLGLPVSYGIVKEQGGDISVESEPGLGTRFHLLLRIARLDDDPQVIDARSPDHDG